MKKILLPVALVAMMVLGACNGKTASTTGDTAADFKSKIENCTNTDSIQVYVTQAKDYIQKLVDEGKIDEAKKYLAEIEPVVQEKAPKFAAAFETVKTFVDKVPTTGENVADQAKDAVSAAGDSVAAVASDAKDAVVDKAADITKAVGDKATEVTEAAKDKVTDLLK